MSDRRKHRRSAAAALPTMTDQRLELLRYIAETADLLDVGPSDHGVAWLLVPLPLRMLDALAEFEAELAELDEHDDDGEPILGAPEQPDPELDDQRQWAAGATDDREEDPDGLGEEETDLGADEDEMMRGYWSHVRRRDRSRMPL